MRSSFPRFTIISRSSSIFYGTVTFAVVNGKPRLRIFANQQLDELKKKAISSIHNRMSARLKIHRDTLSRHGEHGAGDRRCGTRGQCGCTGKCEKHERRIRRSRRCSVLAMRQSPISLARNSFRPFAMGSRSKATLRFPFTISFGELICLQNERARWAGSRRQLSAGMVHQLIGLQARRSPVRPQGQGRVRGPIVASTGRRVPSAYPRLRCAPARQAILSSSRREAERHSQS